MFKMGHEKLSRLDKSKHILFFTSYFSYLLVILFLGCRHAAIEEGTLIPKKLPPEKRVLLAYHAEKFLSTELESAPLLSEENHPHGFKKSDCARCHTIPSKNGQAQGAAPTVCADCHGKNGVNNQQDSCSSCHKTASEFGDPASGNHASHVLKGPQDNECAQCHPGQRSNSHATGILNVRFNKGGRYIVSSEGKIASCTGLACHEDRDWGGEGCGSCHGSPPETGAHQAHLQPDSTCRDCHRGNQHDDDQDAGVIEIGASGYDATTGACGVSMCHGEEYHHLSPDASAGKVLWGCDSCHGYPPESGNHAQEIHNETCEQCHHNHTHSYKAATRPKDFSGVEVALARQGEYGDDTDDGIANGWCRNIACHQEQKLNIQPIAWGSTCSDCHGNPPDTATHLLHVKEHKNKCEDCHKNAPHDLDNKSGHIEVGGVEYNAITGDCVSSCHEKTLPPVAKPGEPLKWACDICHGYPPQSGNHVFHSKVEYADIADAPKTKISCEECHSEHQHSYKAAITPKEFTDILVKFARGGAFDVKTGLCRNIACHEQLVWGSSCNECHENPPSTGWHIEHIKPDVNCDSCHKDRQHDLDKERGTIDIGGIKYDKFTGSCGISTCHEKEELWKCTSCHGNPPSSGQHEIHSSELKFGCNSCHNKHEHSYKALTAQVEPRDVTVSFTIRGKWEEKTKTCRNAGCHGDRRWERKERE